MRKPFDLVVGCPAFRPVGIDDMPGFRSEYRINLLSRRVHSSFTVPCSKIVLFVDVVAVCGCDAGDLDRHDDLNPKTLQLTTHAIYEPQAKINSSYGSLKVASHIPSLVGEIVMHMPAHEPLLKH